MTDPKISASGESVSGEQRPYTDDELLVAFDNVLADYVLANRYEQNARLIPDIRRRMSELSLQLEVRGLTYSHEKAHAAAKRLPNVR